MPSEDVEALRRDFADLRTEVRNKLDTIHNAVLSLAGRVYVPGPSIWKRLGSFLGLVRLG